MWRSMPIAWLSSSSAACGKASSKQRAVSAPCRSPIALGVEEDGRLVSSTMQRMSRPVCPSWTVGIVVDSPSPQFSSCLGVCFSSQLSIVPSLPSPEFECPQGCRGIGGASCSLDRGHPFCVQLGVPALWSAPPQIARLCSFSAVVSQSSAPQNHTLAVTCGVFSWSFWFAT